MGGIPLSTFWISGALVLYGVALILAIGFYTPALRRQIRVLEQEGSGSAAYRQASGRGVAIGLVTMLPILAIIFLMVTKPTL